MLGGMNLNITKRNGELIEFDRENIINAVAKAFIEVDGYVSSDSKILIEQIADEVEKNCYEGINVELIQNMIEDYLMESERSDVAREYIRYRYKKEVARGLKNDFIEAIGEKLSASNVQNQNANVDEYSFGGRIGEASSLLTKNYALDYIVSEKAKNNHLNNRIYIHDLDSYVVGSHNCLSVPFDDLLAKGFNTRQTDVRPANSVNTAFQLVAVIFQLQSLQQFGGVSATHIDWTMVPYVRKSFYKHLKDGVKFLYGEEALSYLTINCLDGLDLGKLPIEAYHNPTVGEEEGRKSYWILNNPDWKQAYEYALEMTEREVYQAVEGMYHNLNTLQSRSGNQLPFTSINYGTCTLPEGRMVTKALLEVSINGLGKLHKTSIFPCGIFQCMKGVNRAPGDPNYDLYQLALKSTATRLYPNYANVDWSGNAGYDRNDPKTYFSTINKTVA